MLWLDVLYVQQETFYSQKLKGNIQKFPRPQ